MGCMCLEFKAQVGAQNLNLGLVGKLVVFKGMRLGEITKREEKNLRSPGIFQHLEIGETEKEWLIKL